MKKSIFFGIFYLSVLYTSPAFCIPINYSFSGSLTNLYYSHGDSNNLPLNVGNVFSGSFTYTPETNIAPHSGSINSDYALYDFIPGSINVNFDSFSLSTYFVNHVSVANCNDYDAIYFEHPDLSGFFLDYFIIEDLNFSFLDSSSTAFNDDSLPSFLNPSAFDTIKLSFSIYTPEGIELPACFEEPVWASITASIDNIAITPVPEPTTMILLCAGLLGLICFERKNSISIT